MKKLLIILLILLLIGFGACGENDDTMPTLTVGTSAGFVPFEYKEGGEIIGFDIDLITEIGKKMKMKIKVNDMDFDSLIESVKSDKIDVIAAGMTITEKRKESVDFTEPYFTADQSVLIKKGSGIEITSGEDVDNANYTIGVQNDTTGAFWVGDNAPSATVKPYGKYIECILDLENGNIDMIVLDKPTASAYAVNRNVEVAYTIITNEQYGFAVKKGSDLLAKINKALKEIKNSTKWDELHKTYFGAK